MSDILQPSQKTIQLLGIFKLPSRLDIYHVRKEKEADIICFGRHELKYEISCQDYLILRSRLRAILKLDEHTDENGEYRIRSLYFDTPGDKALREKINGTDRREKFRIRGYNNCQDSIWLEKKSKAGGLCYKESIPLAAGELTRLLYGDISWMTSCGRPLVTELYSKMRGELLRPRTIVDYIREPFVCRAGNVRVTLDRDVRTGIFCTDFLNADIPTVRAGEQRVLLEVKYDSFIPRYVTDVVQLGDRRASAVSKYALCRMYG